MGFNFEPGSSRKVYEVSFTIAVNNVPNRALGSYRLTYIGYMVGKDRGFDG